jgi:hypothetical protein
MAKTRLEYNLYNNCCIGMNKFNNMKIGLCLFYEQLYALNNKYYNTICIYYIASGEY